MGFGWQSQPTWMFFPSYPIALDHIKPAFESVWATITPTLSDDTCSQIVEGVAAEAGHHSIAELVRRRDEVLLELLQLLAKRDPAL